MQLTFFLLFFTIFIPLAYADVTLSAILLEEGQTGGNGDNEIILDNTSTLDVSGTVQTVTETTTIIDDVTVNLTLEIQFVSVVQNDPIQLINTDLPTVSVEIPDNTVLSAPAEWDQTIFPPTEVSTSGTVSSGFKTPTTSIQVGSPDVVLVFDTAVTIILEGTTGQTAYKLSGTDNWVLIDTCLGTYDSPTDPGSGECSITDGTDTKILTYHFTEFAELEEEEEETVEEPVDEIVEDTTTSSGGSGRTGVGPHGTGSSFSGTILDDTFFFVEPGAQNFYKFPTWFKNVITWKSQGLINDTEYTEAYQWMIKNAIK